MSAPNNKPLSHEDYERFLVYQGDNGKASALHLVLNNYNVKDGHVQDCIKWASQHGDQEGYELGHILLGLSKSQRLKLAKSLP